MTRCVLSLCAAVLAWAALLLTGRPVCAQTSPSGTGMGSPVPAYLRGPTYYPYWSSAPSGYGSTLVPYERPGTVLQPLTGSTYGPRMLSPSSFPGGYRGIGASALSGLSSSILNDPDLRLPGSGYTPASDNRMHIWLRVPANARVFFDGEKTKQTGTLRHYLSPPLTPGRTYHYDVQVRWEQDGKAVERKEKIEVRAGGSRQVDLTGK